MRMFLMNSGSRILRAPENDQGGADDENQDDDLEFDLNDDDQDDDDQDDGDDDQDDGADNGDDDDQDDPPPQRKQPSRAETRVAKLARETAALRRELEEARRTPAQPQERRASQAELDAAERELLVGMTPEERLDYKIEKNARIGQQQLQAIAFQGADATDKMAFASKVAGNRLYARVADKVEAELQKMRDRGQNTDRETIARYLIGVAVTAKAGATTPKAQRKAANNRQREAGRPGGNRSDHRGSGGRLTEAQARAKRLDGQLI